jgi:hypothetical protein
MFLQEKQQPLLGGDVCLAPAPHTSGAQQKKPYSNCSVNELVYLRQRCRNAAEREAKKDAVGMWTTSM